MKALTLTSSKAVLLVALAAATVTVSGAANASAGYMMSVCYTLATAIPSQPVPYFYGSFNNGSVKVVNKTYALKVVGSPSYPTGKTCIRMDADVSEKAFYADWSQYNLPNGGVSTVPATFKPPKACIGDQCVSCTITKNVDMKYNGIAPSGYRMFYANVDMTIKNYGGSIGCDYGG